MSGLYITMASIILLSCIVLIVLVLMQEKRTSGIGGGMSGAASGQTYWDKNKGRSLEGTLEKYTKILGALVLILSVIIAFVH